jgi:hypothetical protein
MTLPIDRRLSFTCTAGAFVWLLRALPSLADASSSNGDQRLTRVNWDQFVNHIEAVAEKHRRGTLASSSFVQDIATLGARLDLTDKSLTGAYSFLRNRQLSSHSPMIVAEATRRVSFDVVLLSLDKGYSIPLHDHPSRSVTSICAAGQSVIANYDLRESLGRQILRLRSRSVIGPAAAGTLTESDGNVHTITALTPSQFIDVLSPPAPPSGWFHWYKAEPESADRSTLRVTSVFQ